MDGCKKSVLQFAIYSMLNLFKINNCLETNKRSKSVTDSIFYVFEAIIVFIFLSAYISCDFIIVFNLHINEIITIYIA